MKRSLAIAVASLVAVVGVTAGAIAADGGKKPLTKAEGVALVNEMLAAGKIDQATADKKLAYFASGKAGIVEKAGACAWKKKLSPQQMIALVGKMVAAGKLDQATGAAKIEAIRAGAAAKQDAVAAKKADVAAKMAAFGVTKKPGACAAKAKLSTADTIALIQKMVAAGKLDQATADQKLASLAGK